MADDTQTVRVEVTREPEPAARSTRAFVTTGPPVLEGLAELRKLAGLTQTQLARRLRVSPQSVQKLEVQPDPKLSSLRRYVEALDGGGLEVRVGLPRHGWMTLRLPEPLAEA